MLRIAAGLIAVLSRSLARPGGPAFAVAIWLGGAGCVVAPAAAQQAGSGTPPQPGRLTLWELSLGSHARELPRLAYADLACGTNGGPPSTPLQDWGGYARCQPERGSGLREVYLRYDDEMEYRGKAQDPLGLSPFRIEGTTEFQIPVIVSALFDDKGFLVGMRMVSDPRTTDEIRERGTDLAGALRSRFGNDGWTCRDLPPAEGESPFRGTFTKQRCQRKDADGTLKSLDTNYYRRAGQNIINPVTRVIDPAAFTSETRYEAVLVADVANPEERLAAIVDAPLTDVEILAQRARSCAGCNLRGANLKRADLRNASLARADLTGANLHGANLAGADLTGARLEEAVLNRAELRQAALAGADLFNAQMYSARLDGANLTGADMSGALAARIQMISAKGAGLLGVGADMRYARLSNADFRGADFPGALLQDSQLARADLRGAHLERTVFANASLTEVDLSEAAAVGADLTGANLRDADLTNADFSEAILDLANVSGAKTAGAKFDGASSPPRDTR